MAGPTLSQNEIDRLLSSTKQKQQTASTADQSRSVSTFDFRTPSKFTSAFVREFSELHKGFTRVMSETLTRELRAPVTVELFGTEQLTYDAYVRSMPNPSVISILALDPLPGLAVLDFSTQLGLVLVDRMLGGPGRPVSPRQPTQLEQTLLGSILDHPLAALAETFDGVIEVTPRFVTSELNPAFAHAANPTEMVLVVTFSLEVESAGPSTKGLLGLCYPLAVLGPIKDAMRQARWTGRSSTDDNHDETISRLIVDAPVEVQVHTGATSIPASALVALSPGDVLILDHGAEEPLIGSIESIPFMRLALGRQGPELAARLQRWT
jgi:flagellar motor switch protein FliM